jgi:hypothetical protein
MSKHVCGMLTTRLWKREKQRESAGVGEALGLVGAWSDLDWDEMIEALDRIRHESKPTPPIEL